MLDIYKKTIRSDKLESVNEAGKGSWVLAIEPSSDEIDFLVNNLKLERGHIMDALDPHETPRLEIEKSGLYIYLRFPFLEDDEIHTMPVLFVLTDDIVVSITKDNKGLFDDFLGEKVEFYTTQKTKFLLYLFLKISILYRGYLNTINKKIRGREDRLAHIGDKEITDFVRWERVLNDFLTALVPSIRIYETLLSRQYLQYFREDQDLVEDLTLSNTETVDICKTSIKMIVNLREAYSTLMTNNLNRAIKFLTAITIILTLPTMIASIYGMNIPLPLQHNLGAFPIIMGITVLVVAVAFWIFYKRDWL